MKYAELKKLALQGERISINSRDILCPHCNYYSVINFPNGISNVNSLEVCRSCGKQFVLRINIQVITDIINPVPVMPNLGGTDAFKIFECTFKKGG